MSLTRVTYAWFYRKSDAERFCKMMNDLGNWTSKPYWHRDFQWIVNYKVK